MAGDPNGNFGYEYTYVKDSGDLYSEGTYTGGTGETSWAGKDIRQIVLMMNQLHDGQYTAAAQQWNKIADQILQMRVSLVNAGNTLQPEWNPSQSDAARAFFDRIGASTWSLDQWITVAHTNAATMNRMAKDIADARTKINAINGTFQGQFTSKMKQAQYWASDDGQRAAASQQASVQVVPMKSAMERSQDFRDAATAATTQATAEAVAVMKTLGQNFRENSVELVENYTFQGPTSVIRPDIVMKQRAGAGGGGLPAIGVPGGAGSAAQRQLAAQQRAAQQQMTAQQRAAQQRMAAAQQAFAAQNSRTAEQLAAQQLAAQRAAAQQQLAAAHQAAAQQLAAQQLAAQQQMAALQQQGAAQQFAAQQLLAQQAATQQQFQGQALTAGQLLAAGPAGSMGAGAGSAGGPAGGQSSLPPLRSFPGGAAPGVGAGEGNPLMSGSRWAAGGGSALAAGANGLRGRFGAGGFGAPGGSTPPASPMSPGARGAGVRMGAGRSGGPGEHGLRQSPLGGRRSRDAGSTDDPPSSQAFRGDREDYLTDASEIGAAGAGARMLASGAAANLPGLPTPPANGLTSRTSGHSGAKGSSVRAGGPGAGRGGPGSMGSTRRARNELKGRRKRNETLIEEEFIAPGTDLPADLYGRRNLTKEVEAALAGVPPQESALPGSRGTAGESQPEVRPDPAVASARERPGARPAASEADELWTVTPEPAAPEPEAPAPVAPAAKRRRLRGHG